MAIAKCGRSVVCYFVVPKLSRPAGADRHKAEKDSVYGAPRLLFPCIACNLVPRLRPIATITQYSADLP